jgi:hypothetical protein
MLDGLIAIQNGAVEDRWLAVVQDTVVERLECADRRALK